MRKTTLLAGLALAGLLLSAFAGSILAYSGQVAGQVVVSGPDFTIACGYDWTLKAHVTESGTGDPIDGQPVHWQIVTTPDSSDTLSDTDTVTNASGDTQTKLHVGSAYGQRAVEATADQVTSQFTVDCEANGLPPTSVADSTTPVSSSFNWALVAAAGAVLAGFGIIGLRFARR